MQPTLDVLDEAQRVRGRPNKFHDVGIRGRKTGWMPRREVRKDDEGLDDVEDFFASSDTEQQRQADVPPAIEEELEKQYIRYDEDIQNQPPEPPAKQDKGRTPRSAPRDSVLPYSVSRTAGRVVMTDAIARGDDDRRSIPLRQRQLSYEQAESPVERRKSLSKGYREDYGRLRYEDEEPYPVRQLAKEFVDEGGVVYEEVVVRKPVDYEEVVVRSPYREYYSPSKLYVDREYSPVRRSPVRTLSVRSSRVLDDEDNYRRPLRQEDDYEAEPVKQIQLVETQEDREDYGYVPQTEYVDDFGPTDDQIHGIREEREDDDEEAVPESDRERSPEVTQEPVAKKKRGRKPKDKTKEVKPKEKVKKVVVAEDEDDKESEEDAKENRETKEKKKRETHMQIIKYHALENVNGRPQRNRIKPLDFWANEKANVKLKLDPDLNVRVPVIEEVIRNNAVAQPKATKKPKKRVKKERIVASSSEEELEPQDIPQIDIVNPVTGDTEPRTLVVPFSAVNLKEVAGGKFNFTKTFAEGSFISSGYVVLPPDGEKPNKNTKDTVIVFLVVSGIVEVTIHSSTFKVSANTQFAVPRGNQYRLKNGGSKEARLFFVQGKEILVQPSEEN